MLKDITIGQHFPGNSVVHKMDPRLKIVLIIAYIIVLFMSTNIPGLLLCGVCAFSLYKVAKVPVKMLVKSIKPLSVADMFSAVFMSNPFCTNSFKARLFTKSSKFKPEICAKCFLFMPVCRLLKSAFFYK